MIFSMWSEALSWEGLSHLADALGVVAAVPFLVTSAYFVSRARRYRRRLRQLEGVTSARPVALAVSLAGTRIRPAVQAFCARFGQPVNPTTSLYNAKFYYREVAL